MAKSFLYDVFDLMSDRQCQYLWKHTMNEITRMPRDTAYDKLDLIIKIMSHASHLRIPRYMLVDSKVESSPVKVLQLLGSASTYATNNKIVGNNLMQLLNILSWDIIKFNDWEIEKDILKLYINKEITREEALIDVTKSNKYWEFKWDSGAKYTWTTRDLVSLTYDQVIDMIKWTCVIEDHEEYADFILNDELITSLWYVARSAKLWFMRSYIAYVAWQSEENKFYKVFTKWKEEQSNSDVKTQWWIKITNDNKSKNDVEMKF